MQQQDNTPVRTTFWTANFILVMIANLFIFFSFQMIFPTLPLYVQKLGGTDSVIGLIIGAFTVSSILTRPFAGILLDRKNRKIIFSIGLLILIMTAVAYSFAASVTMILYIRLLHGIGWGVAGTASSTIASDIIPKERFGEGIGYFSLTNSFALAIAPAAGIYIALSYGFHDLFLFASGLAGVALILSLNLKCPHRIKENPPLPKLPVYEKSAYGASFLNFFVAVTYGAVASFLPIYGMQKGIHNIGNFFTVYAIAILVTRPLIGKIIDRYGFDFALIPGFMCLFFGVLLLSSAATLPVFLIVAVVYGIGFGATQTSLQTMAVRNVAKNRLGAANATFFTALDAGIGLGAIVMGSVAEIVGYSQMYLYAASGVFLSFVFYLIFVRRHHLQKAQQVGTH